MIFIELLKKILKGSTGKDKRLLKAEVRALIGNDKARKSLRGANQATMDRLNRELAEILECNIDLGTYEMVTK